MSKSSQPYDMASLLLRQIRKSRDIETTREREISRGKGLETAGRARCSKQLIYPCVLLLVDRVDGDFYQAHRIKNGLRFNFAI